jgi:hypothetical protein
MSVYEGEVYKLLKYIAQQCNHIRQIKPTPEVLEDKSDVERQDIQKSLEVMASRIRWFYIQMYHKWCDIFRKILALLPDKDSSKSISILNDVTSDVKILKCLDLMAGRVIDEDTLLILLIRLDSIPSHHKLIMDNIAMSLRTTTTYCCPLPDVNLVFTQLDTWNKVGALTIGFLHCPFHLAKPHFQKLDSIFSKANPEGTAVKYEDCLSVEKYLDNLKPCYENMYKLIHISNIVEEMIPAIRIISMRDKDGRLLTPA